MTDLKVVIPMAGLGKRLAQLTRYKPKALVRLTDRRLIDHVLDAFQELGRNHSLEYIFILGYLGEQIQEYMRNAHPDKKVSYYYQDQLMGQSHAVYLAKESLSGPLFLTYCDTINRIDFSTLSFETMDGLATVQEVDDPSRHGIAIVDADHVVTKLVEKPKTGEHKLALTGFYYFSEGQKLTRAIETQLERGTALNNEYYLADAINIMVEHGARIKTKKALQWLDAGTPEAILETNASLLEQRSIDHKEMESNLLIDPVYVDKRARIENSIIGPNVTIGANCTITDSIIRNTIVDDGTSVNRAILINSLIGWGCSIHGEVAQSILSDNDEVTINYAMNKVSPAGQAG